MNVLEQIAHSTLRVLTFGPSGAGSGTGFLVSFDIEGGYIPILCTNRHVVEGFNDFRLVFTLRKSGEDAPDYGKSRVVDIVGGASAWIFHPTLDLAALPIASVIQSMESSGYTPFYRYINSSYFASESQINELSPVHSVLMVGYPIGLADEWNNLPLMRRGVTASNPKLDFNGKPEFVIDCACFPGSSGSPIIVHDENPSSLTGGITFGLRSFLLGVLWGGPQHLAKGEIKPAPIPMSQGEIFSSYIPANLGFCIKAKELNYFGEEFKRILNEKI